MTEIEKIAYAKSFIDKLANGINPIDNKPVPEQDTLNNVRLSRCFFYVSDILRQVIEAGGVAHRKSGGGKEPFSITREQLSRFPYSDTPITVSDIAKRINSLIDADNMKTFNYRELTKWLLSIEVLTEQTDFNGKALKRPTEAGKLLGLSLETRSGAHGDYRVVLYSREAQGFIIDNMEAILAAGEGE